MGTSALTRRREPHSWRGPQACTRGCLGPREHTRGHMPALKVCVSHTGKYTNLRRERVGLVVWIAQARPCGKKSAHPCTNVVLQTRTRKGKTHLSCVSTDTQDSSPRRLAGQQGGGGVLGPPPPALCRAAPGEWIRPERVVRAEAQAGRRLEVTSP